MNTPYSKSVNEVIEMSRRNSEIRQSTPLMNKQHQHNNNNNNNIQEHYSKEDYKEQPLNPNELIKHNYGYKRSILRKLMIAQRKKFMMKKEKVDFNRLKDNLADTSISNFSQADGYVDNKENSEKAANVNASNNDINQPETIK